MNNICNLKNDNLSLQPLYGSLYLVVIFMVYLNEL